MAKNKKIQDTQKRIEQLLEMAWDTESTARILAITSQILELDPNNIEALILKSDNTKDVYKRIEILNKALNSINTSKNLNDELKITKVLEMIIEFYKPVLEELEDDSDERLKDFPVLIQLASNYRVLENFLTDFALDPPDSKLSSSKVTYDASENRDKVVLSTIHSAKGLEWDTVFVISLNEGSFPSEKAVTKIDDLEEERRLFYVACSRKGKA